MSKNMDEKFGKILHEGRLVDLDDMTIEEREELIKSLEKKAEQIENELDIMLDVER